MLSDGDGWKVFNQMLVELSKLNLKYLQPLQQELENSGAIHPWYGDYHRRLKTWIETEILERTILR